MEGSQRTSAMEAWIIRAELLIVLVFVLVLVLVLFSFLFLFPPFEGVAAYISDGSVDHTS